MTPQDAVWDPGPKTIPWSLWVFSGTLMIERPCDVFVHGRQVSYAPWRRAPPDGTSAISLSPILLCRPCFRFHMLSVHVPLSTILILSLSFVYRSFKNTQWRERKTGQAFLQKYREKGSQGNTDGMDGKKKTRTRNREKISVCIKYLEPVGLTVQNLRHPQKACVS